MKYIKIFLTFLSHFILFSFQIEIQSDFYTKLSQFNYFDSDSSFLINTFDSISQLKCFSICTKNSKCFYIVYQNRKCFICGFNLIYFAKYTTNGNSLVYQKKLNSTNNLINYWSFNGNVNDAIGNANLYGGVNAALTTDRFGRASSALKLSNGYYKVPPGVYFSGTQLTIMGWVYVRSFQRDSRLIELGNGPDQENIVLTVSGRYDATPYFYFKSGSDKFYDYPIIQLNLNQWKHLACIFSFPFYSIYIDGIEFKTQFSKTNFASFSFANVNRTSNFIGRSNWLDDLDADAYFDDLKLFNRALTQQEIQFEMNNNF